MRHTNPHQYEPGIEQVQALADISHSVLCCHSNETRAPIEYPRSCAQLEGTPTILLSYTWVRAVVWECDEGQTHRCMWPIYILHRLRLTRNVMISGLSKSTIFDDLEWSSRSFAYYKLFNCNVLLSFAPMHSVSVRSVFFLELLQVSLSPHGRTIEDNYGHPMK